MDRDAWAGSDASAVRTGTVRHDRRGDVMGRRGIRGRCAVSGVSSDLDVARGIRNALALAAALWLGVALALWWLT